MPETHATHGAIPLRPVTLAGLNAWFACAGLPWLFMDAPSLTQTSLHWAPLLLLLGSLLWLRRPTIASQRARWLTVWMGLFPAGLGVLTALRERASESSEMPGFGLLLCVMSLWWFVAAASTSVSGVSTDIGAIAARTKAIPKKDVWQGALAVTAVIAALVLLTVAPRWLETNVRQGAWQPSVAAGGLLTVAAATALAVGVLLQLLGPSALTSMPPQRRVRMGHLVQALVLAAFGAVTYWLTATG